ncbi:FKBP-type peptidyl-prolyl cis-trans isomerase [Niabella aquatica]
MKQLSIISLSLVLTMNAFAQTKAKPKTTTPVKKPVVTQNVNTQAPLKNLADSASYAIGQNIAQSISKDLKSLNKDAFLQAIKNIFDSKAPKFSEEQLRSILTQFSQQEQESEAKATIDTGRAFLEKNKTNPGVKTTASGLQYEVIKEGTGDKPGASDTVVCNYKGTLTDGTPFDNSYDRGAPLTIHVSNVIPGWTEGLQLMSKGSKYKFYIPQELGYGLRGAGDIPPGSTLIFEVELLDIKKGE